jgi:cytochrome P450
MQSLFWGVLPRIVARRAYTNREVVQAVLMKFYGERLDENDDVAEVTKVRARFAREAGVSYEDLGRLEMALMFVGTTNTIPTLFWFFVNVWLRPDVVEITRKEVIPFVKLTPADDGKGRRAILDITQLETNCPVLVSCYRESIRLGNQAMGNRFVMQDTVLTDDDGTSYLLKKNTFVMWSAKELHRSESVWDDALGFHPERFVPEKQTSALDRARRLSYIPFGGGKHLCPGRNFAFAENLALVGALVVGFDIVGLDAANVRLGTTSLGEAIAKPPADAQGGSFTIKRRKDWEDVEWAYKC